MLDLQLVNFIRLFSCLYFFFQIVFLSFNPPYFFLLFDFLSFFLSFFYLLHSLFPFFFIDISKGLHVLLCFKLVTHFYLFGSLSPFLSLSLTHTHTHTDTHTPAQSQIHNIPCTFSLLFFNVYPS